MVATKEATLITEPPPPSSRCGIPCLQQRKTLRRLTSCTRCQASRSVSSTEPSSVGLIPALSISTSLRPNCSRASASRLVVGVDADDLRALGGEEARGLGADPARGAGDDADLVIQPSPHLSP